MITNKQLDNLMKPLSNDELVIRRHKFATDVIKLFRPISELSSTISSKIKIPKYLQEPLVFAELDYDNTDLSYLFKMAHALWDGLNKYDKILWQYIIYAGTTTIMIASEEHLEDTIIALQDVVSDNTDTW